MAGTRFLIQTSFFIQIPLLVILALFYESRNDGFQTNINHKFFSYRDDSFRLEEVHSRINTLMNERKNHTLPISIPLTFVVPHEFTDSKNLHNDDDKGMKDMANKFHKGISPNASAKNSHFQIHVTFLEMLSYEIFWEKNSISSKIDCDHLNFSNIIGMSETLNEHEYPIMIAFGCTDELFLPTLNNQSNQNKRDALNTNAIAKVNIHESGFVLVQVRGNGFETKEANSQSTLNYDLINGPVAQAISDNLLFYPSHELSTSASFELKPSYQVTITFLDQDPSSSPFHYLLGSHLLESIQQTLHPFLNTLRTSHLTSLQIQPDLIAYTGPNFPATTKKEFESNHSPNIISINNNYEDKTDAVYTVLGSSMLDWFSKDILDSAPHRFSQSPSYLVPTADLSKDNYVAIKDLATTHLQFVILFPSTNNAPLYIQNQERKGRRRVTQISDEDVTDSYHILGKGGISILNLNTVSVQMKDKILDDMMDNTMSIIASQIRQELGLSYYPPHRQNSNLKKAHKSKTMVEIVFAYSNGGVTKWELDMLLRYWIPIKFHSVLDKINNLSHLLEIKSGIEISSELSNNLNECINLLEGASLLLQKSSSTILSEVMKKIHTAEILAQNAALDSSMMEHNHTPPEHMMAVFTPLLLPLALPIIVGMIKEWKRYKGLSKKKLILETNKKAHKD